MAATIHINHRHLLLLLSPIADTHFYRPTEVGRLSRPRHCRKGARPVLGQLLGENVWPGHIPEPSFVLCDFRPHRHTTYVDAAYGYRPSSVVCLSVLSVCVSQSVGCARTAELIKGVVPC